MKIIITGALGHIGSRLIRNLPGSFNSPEIVMIDNLFTQRFPSLFSLPAEGRYRFIEADVLTAELEALFSGADVVVHLAAITNASGSFDIRDQVEQVNLDGTKKVAQACVKAGVPMIFLSTTSVYGTQAEVVDEDCSPEELKPQSPYAESKLSAERMLEEMSRNQGLRFVTCRFGTIFGVSPGMRFHTAINKFCWQAVMGEPITVWRTALNQFRPYLDIVDAVNALTMIIRKNLYDCRVYNVVTINTSVRSIIDVISGFVPDVSVKFVDTQIMNQLSYHVSNQRFLETGYEYRGDLVSGIKDTIELLKGSRSWRQS